ncbi:MAG: ABC transporter ATP-binding protein, partial [Bifidobacteriaceae bacterium]|nr:ABC transporter ATP-binding protein [Bifidobacteriaceae bacterium]
IELGVGFNPELTGRENVYLNGALLGFSRSEIDDMYDDIVEFAELEDFMDQKLKNYSSGMQVRLAFSVAIKAQGDILVLDEVLAVGDEAFQTKCNSFFNEIKKDSSKTVILVTHSMASVKKYCNRAIFIQDGKIVVDGDINEAANLYTESNLQSLRKEEKIDKDEEHNEKAYEKGLNETVTTLKITPVSPLVLSSKESFVFDIECEYTKKEPYFLAFSMTDNRRGGIPYDSGKIEMGMGGKGKTTKRFTLPLSIFNNGTYQINASLRKQDPDDKYHTIMMGFTNEENSCIFSISEDAKGTDYALLKYDVVDLQQE